MTILVVYSNPKERTIVNGKESESSFDKFYFPYHVILDDDFFVCISDVCNNRIIKWAPGINGTDQMTAPESFVIDRKRFSN